jgi:class 3 adenylate cyclase
MLAGLTETVSEGWGTDRHVYYQVPSRADDARFRAWYAKKTRAIAAPGAAEAYFRSISVADARSLLPSIQVPTLVLQRADYRFMPVEQGRFLADQIAGAELVELPGSDGPLFWEHPDLALDAIERFLTRMAPRAPTTRTMATVVYTDIVDSTRRMEEMGDTHWRAVLDLHDDIAERLIEGNGGRLIKTTGDGVLATFDGPGRGIRFASDFRDEIDRIGIAIRCGIHTGEVEMRGDDIGGMAVHLAARIIAKAAPGEILVSRTVRDLVAGSDLVFDDRGTHQLKGIEGRWHLLAVRDDGPA